MTVLLRYLTHPQVRIDPAVPVPEWTLNEIGAARVHAFAARQAVRGTTLVVSSAERKAIETAEPIARSLGIELAIRKAMHENDRSATGFLLPTEFEAVADAFFANPDTSIRGWERAVDAQARIVRETDVVLADHRDGDVLLVGHGGVGTLLYCHLAGVPIARFRDQPAGGGNIFACDLATKRMVHDWIAMENITD